MRVLVLLVFVLTMSACSGLMVSGGSTNSSAAEAERERRLAEAADTATTDRVRRAFAADPELGKLTIYVSTKAGMVRVSGSVPSYETREKAEKLAMATDGVNAVENKITVEFSN